MVTLELPAEGCTKILLEVRQPPAEAGFDRQICLLHRHDFASGIRCIESRNSIKYSTCVPSSTDSRIDELCEKIRRLCGKPLNPKSEVELRKLARELRAAIKEHVRMAKSSLDAKKAAIEKRDPGKS